MSKVSFKQFVVENTMQSKVMDVVRELIDAKNIVSTEHPDNDVLKHGKSIAHKYIDTSEGPWIVEVLKHQDNIIARATPPKSRDDKPMYFVASVSESADEIFNSAGLISEERMRNVIGSVYSSNQFSFKDKTFVAEISDVRGALKQLWNDSADIGFGIKSERTGEVALFTLHKQFKDNEGDITHWEFNVYNPKHDAKLNGLKAVIFND